MLVQQRISRIWYKTSHLRFIDNEALPPYGRASWYPEIGVAQARRRRGLVG